MQWSRYDAEYDFYLAYAGASSTFVRPHIVALEAGGEVEALLVARLDRLPLPTTVGYRTVFNPTIRQITVAHGGFAGISHDVLPLLVRELRQSLARGEADAVLIPPLAVDSPVFDEIERQHPTTLVESGSRPAMHRRLTLPANGEEFVSTRSKGTRRSVKSRMNKVERTLGAELELRVYRDPSDLDRIFADIDPLAASTYQHGLGAALADTPLHRALIGIGLRRGWFRAYVLSHAGQTVAFWPGMVHRGIFYSDTPGYDPAYAADGIGTYLMVRMIEDLCGDPTVVSLDWSFGDAEYKRRFSTESWAERDMRVFAKRARPVLINGVRSSVATVATTGKRTLARYGQLGKVKRRQRRRLSRSL